MGSAQPHTEYFGGHDFADERVLDIGTASGALAFEMERRGASEVVRFDLEDGYSYDCRLPAEAETLDEMRRWVACHSENADRNAAQRPWRTRIAVDVRLRTSRLDP